VSIITPSYMTEVEGLCRSQVDHSEPTPIWPMTLSPILTVFDMILMEVVGKVVWRVVGDMGRLRDDPG
jgi:hypothetical protein